MGEMRGLSSRRDLIQAGSDPERPEGLGRPEGPGRSEGLGRPEDPERPEGHMAPGADSGGQRGQRASAG